MTNEDTSESVPAQGPVSAETEECEIRAKIAMRMPADWYPHLAVTARVALMSADRDLERARAEKAERERDEARALLREWRDRDATWSQRVDALLGAEPGEATPLAASLHPDTAALVDRFAVALREKLAKAEAKYGYSDGWARKDWMPECRAALREHVEKGDPRDVAAYCAFLWHHGESTAIAEPGEADRG